MNTRHFSGRRKSQVLHKQCVERWNKQRDDSISKMHEVPEKRCALPYSYGKW